MFPTADLQHTSMKSYTVNGFNVRLGSKVLVRLASQQLDLLLEKSLKRQDPLNQSVISDRCHVNVTALNNSM